MVMPSNPRHGVLAPAAILTAILCLWSHASLAQDMRVRAGSQQVVFGTCDASAAAIIPGDGPNPVLVVNDEKENLIAVQGEADFDPADIEAPLFSADAAVRQWLTANTGAPAADVAAAHMRNEADLEGTAWLGDQLYVITSHGRNSEGERRLHRERLVALNVRRAGTVVTVSAVEGRLYAGLLYDLAALPLLREFADPGLGKSAMRAPERAGLNIEGLAAGADGTLLLLGLRNPLAPDGRAIIVPLLNPTELRSPPSVTRARFGDPILLRLDNRGIRSIEYVPRLRRFLIVAGPTGDDGDFDLYSWSGSANDRPALVQGAAEILRHGAPDVLRPEGMVVNEEATRILLISDDGGRRIEGQPCRGLGDNRQFRTMELIIE